MDSLWMYNPSLALAILATILYGISFLWLFYTTIIKYRAWFFTCVVFGAAVEVAGYAGRCYSIKAPTEISPFVVTLSLIVLAPVFVAAGNYLLMGRLVQLVLPTSSHSIFGIPARFITRLFVCCDIVSFLIQCSGSGLASSDNWSGPNEKIGVNILIAGLSLQVIAFAVYLAILVRFHVLANELEIPQSPRGWRKVVTAVYVSSSLIMLRSIYRVVEFAQGIEGYPFTHEWIFWVFEAAPMLVAISIFCLYHPSKYLGRDGGKKRDVGDEEMTSQDEVSGSPRRN